MNDEYDVVIVGAGASGLMCAAEAARRGRSTLVLDAGNKPGRKILVAGGGKCNFTNTDVTPDHYVSRNPHFSRSALARFGSGDILAMAADHGIEWEEREHGRLFTVESSRLIRDMMLKNTRDAGAVLRMDFPVDAVEREPDGRYVIRDGKKLVRAASLVLATGGLSWPKLTVSPLGYKVAEKFGLPVVSPAPGLVPLTLAPSEKKQFAPLSGIAVDARVSTEDVFFRENLLFTHRGLSGPAILQISNYWNPGNFIEINLLPDQPLSCLLDSAKKDSGRINVETLLGRSLPRRLVQELIPENLRHTASAQLSSTGLKRLSEALHRWRIRPSGTEGARTAEVTLGGVDTSALSSKTFECLHLPGLFFIGEVLDVTGQLGGYNLQWAWSSGWCAGQAV